MGLTSALGSLLLFLGLLGTGAGFVGENCSDYKLQFERVFSVPGDVAMLYTTLVSPEVFDFTSVPYNITWYSQRTGGEMSDRPGGVLVRGEALWFLNVTLADDGEYVSVLRTPSRCYMQTTRLVVERPAAGECGRPRKAEQPLTKGVHDTLHCPLKSYIQKLDGYNVSSTLRWYKGCDPIQDGSGSYAYRSKTILTIRGVEFHHNGSYTCTLSFTLAGTAGSMSETVDGIVSDHHLLVPQVREPADNVLKAPLGHSLEKRCLVFVPGKGAAFVDVLWLTRDDFIAGTEPSDGVYTSEPRSWTQDGPKSGTWIERMLMFSELREEDFHLNYTCRVYSSRGFPEAYFTLLPADPDVMLPVGLVLGGAMLLFVCSVVVFYAFKVDIVLCFRRAFPVLYPNTDSDGKLFDAYVAYPQPHAPGFSPEVEAFALHTLPQVLEKACGYKLFIAGRDCLPGQALVESVEENIHASRRVLLLYTASTFSWRGQTSSAYSNNNNNVSKSGDGGPECERLSGEVGPGLQSDPADLDSRQQLECVEAVHRALVERSLQVVLVELEELSPAQLALLPESLRHLRRRQGAICWWRNSKRPTCLSGRGDGVKGLKELQAAAALSPSARFWKDIRYRMPVRGKRAAYPERTALLTL
ncbi:interleukin-1 receptor type 1 [Salarias fasciatus]|uniref:Interleukin-1 receptor type 1-like n=1 Tax=Salarias fasciatus TaxID=181472 RepID=A0A672HWD5_SALFA|nr:interleukin-1 receptor type 1-like [Salarias fasciatus]XP_029968629.1 interleukin-1 receptor type 1-like [Salarias fasciatus]XP_029968630.1 interleukin-1 receptor type 1-like [Salarias fasciatus]